MSDIPPPPPPSPDGPPPVPQDGLQNLGFDAPPIPADPAPVVAAVPAYGEPRVRRVANPGWRVAAFVLDGVGTFVVTSFTVFASLYSGDGPGFWGLLLVPFLATVLATVLTATVGVTPGKALVGLRVVNAETGRPIGGWAVLRSLVIVAPLVLVYLAGLFARLLPDDSSLNFFDSWFGAVFAGPILGWTVLLVVLIASPRHRGLQDLAGRSIVVRR